MSQKQQLKIIEESASENEVEEFFEESNDRIPIKKILPKVKLNKTDNERKEELKKIKQQKEEKKIKENQKNKGRNRRKNELITLLFDYKYDNIEDDMNKTLEDYHELLTTTKDPTNFHEKKAELCGNCYRCFERSIYFKFLEAKQEIKDQNLDYKFDRFYTATEIRKIKNVYRTEWLVNKNDIHPVFVLRNEAKQKRWFKCKICTHEYQQTCNDFESGKGCAYCSGGKKPICPMDCKACIYYHNIGNLRNSNNGRAFIRTDSIMNNKYMAKMWNNTKNKNIDPYNITYGSNTSYYFNCYYCKHELNKPPNNIYQALISNGSKKRDNPNCSCQYCGSEYGITKELCFDDDCIICYKNSLAFIIEKTTFRLTNNNEITNPRYIISGSNDKSYEFICKCGHISSKEPKKLIDKNGNIYRGCKFCTHQAICKIGINCDECKEHSVGNTEWKRNFEKNNDINPYEIRKGSKKHYLFECENNHLFSARTSSLCCDGNGCPYCGKKTEAKLFKFLNDHYENVSAQKSFKWCKKTRELLYDFKLGNVIIELDGRQHFEIVKLFQNEDKLENNIHNDIFKNIKGISKNYKIIRIFQEDVWFDENDWSLKLIDSIDNAEENIICIGGIYRNKSYYNDINNYIKKDNFIKYIKDNYISEIDYKKLPKNLKVKFL